MNYSLSPAKYIELEEYIAVHRDYSEIMSDINRIIAEKNSCKLVINETLAKALGLDVATFKADTAYDEQNEFYKKISGQSILKQDYIQFTKTRMNLHSKQTIPNICQQFLRQFFKCGSNILCI